MQSVANTVVVFFTLARFGSKVGTLNQPQQVR